MYLAPVLALLVVPALLLGLGTTAAWLLVGAAFLFPFELLLFLALGPPKS